MKKIECPICGKVFETERHNKKYCCLSCQAAGKKLQRMKWDDNHKGYSANYMRTYRKREKNGDLHVEPIK